MLAPKTEGYKDKIVRESRYTVCQAAVELQKNNVSLIKHTGKQLSKKAQNRKQSCLGECMTS